MNAINRITDSWLRATDNLIPPRIESPVDRAYVVFDQQPHGETTSEVIAYQEHSNPTHRFDGLRDFP